MIHWGSPRARTGTPRISISMEFIDGTADLTPEDLPRFDGVSSLPTFAQRLAVVGNAILDYQTNEPLMVRFVELAKRLVEHLGERQ